MFNPPPPDLNDREPLIYTASTSEIWYRSHRIGHDPVFFGENQAHR